MPHREKARASAIPDAGLGVDVFDVAACGLARDRQLLRNVSVGESACEQPQYLDLSRGQPSGELATLPGAVAGRLQYRLHGVSVEESLANAGPKRGSSLLRCQLHSVWPRLR